MSKEISRRKLIGAVATTALGSAVLVGCVAAVAPAPPPPPPGPPPPPPGPPPEAEAGGGYGGGAAGAPPMPKQTKAEARYQDHPNGSQRCGLCANFVPPNDCRVIEGPVMENGWCRNFRARA